MANLVLILSPAHDIHALAVSREIQRLGFFPWIVDLTTYPLHFDLSAEFTDSTELRFVDGDGAAKCSTDICSIWRRRVGQPQISDELTLDTDREIASQDSRDAVVGMSSTFESLGGLVVNSGVAESSARNKQFQLSQAVALGIPIPKTLITNSPEAAQSFSQELDNRGVRVVYKCFTSPKTMLVPTKFVRHEDQPRFRLLRNCPAIFQEYIIGRDLRITVVGKSVFSAEIVHSSEAGDVDWRVDPRHRTVPFQLDRSHSETILALMDRLNLVYGALDCKLEPDGRLVFLEVNPAGQYLFVEIEAGHPISAALAGVLCGVAE